MFSSSQNLVASQAESLEAQRAQLEAMRQSLETKQVAMAEVQKQLARVRAVKAAGGTKVWRDWGSKYGEGLPEKVMEKIARKGIMSEPKPTQYSTNTTATAQTNAQPPDDYSYGNPRK